MNQLPQNKFGNALAHPGLAPHAARVVEPTGPAFIPPPAPMPTASISPKGLLSLHTSLVKELGLAYGRPIDLHPPVHNSKFWHLDLRPKAAHMVTCYDNQRPRVEGIKLPEGLVTETITLYLMPGDPEYPNVYPMLPSNAFTP